MNKFCELTPDEKTLLQKVPFPQWENPMLATLTHKRFSDPDWIFEPKFDGERALTFYDGRKTKILSRNKSDLNGTYPELVDALKNQAKASFIVDGEIVAFDRNVTSFSRLQQRLGLKDISSNIALSVPVYYYIFDILYLDGYDLKRLPLKSRKNLLQQALLFQDPLRLTEGVFENGEDFYKSACEIGWEGIMAKRLSSFYQGHRSTDWLKFKCHKGQELIILGYTAPKGRRQYFGALLVGYYKDHTLCYAGKVGTGFNNKTLVFLKRKMDQHISPAPVVAEPAGASGITWVKPVLVGEFAFTEWTKKGRLRHPRFKGLRQDKSANDVVREEAL